jgi:hypothetical protein
MPVAAGRRRRVQPDGSEGVVLSALVDVAS